ncbi:hypothetical protein KJ987_07580 [bacterium]|nr:hypothetical protein [bacterium]
MLENGTLSLNDRIKDFIEKVFHPAVGHRVRCYIKNAFSKTLLDVADIKLYLLYLLYCRNITCYIKEEK